MWQILKRMTVALVLLALGAGTAYADGYGYNRVYGRIEPYPTYNANAGYAYEQPAQRPYQGYDYAPRKTLGTKIREGFRDAFKTPAFQNGLIGAGTGLGAAALAERNLLRGSVIGAGVGVGMGVMDENYYFSRHPLVRRASKGALVGLGAAAATGAAALLPAAAVGLGVGAGVHYIKRH